MKKAGFEVGTRRAVCVDFADGRVLSLRPGTRFEADPSNPVIARLLRVGEIRKLGPRESAPPLPVKLGAPRRVQDALSAQAEIAQANAAINQTSASPHDVA